MPARWWLAPLGLVLLGFLPYLGTFAVPFVFDDLPNLVENPLIRDVSLFFSPARAASVGASPVQLAGYRTRWLAMLTFALNYRIGGLEVAGYHAVNLAIHLLAGLLLFRLVHRTLALPRFDRSALRGRERLVAFFSAALFLAHPLQTQAVTYVVQRMASLAALLCLLALVAWLEARTAARPLRRWTFYLLSLAALLGAMASKQSAATFPLVLLLFDLLFLDGSPRRRWLGLLPPLATMAVVPVTLLGSGASAGSLLGNADTAARAGSALARLDYLATQGPVLVTYLRLLVWPAGQNLDWDVPVYRGFAHAPVLLSFLLLATLAALAGVLISRSRRGADPAWGWAGFGVLWFFLALAVESSLVPIQDLLVEHRLYLPSAGLLAAAVAALALVAPARRARALAALLALATLALAAATVHRNRVWSSPLSLWRDAAQKSPGLLRPRYNLGSYLLRAGQLAEAETELSAAVALDPGFVGSLSHLGLVALGRGQLDLAVSRFERAIAVDAGRLEPRYGLAEACFRKGDYERMAATLRAAARIDPSNATRVRLAVLLGEVRGLVGAGTGGTAAAHRRMAAIFRAAGRPDLEAAELDEAGDLAAGKPPDRRERP